VAYEPAYEAFTACTAEGRERSARFKRAGFLSLGDQPEVYFYIVDGSEIIVALSGDGLRQFQQPPRRALSREEKIDITGLRLKKEIESGRELQNLYIGGIELEELARELALSV
jgi:hypothetical protein